VGVPKRYLFPLPCIPLKPGEGISFLIKYVVKIDGRIDFESAQP
jgi:hypothetical protein